MALQKNVGQLQRSILLYPSFDVWPISRPKSPLCSPLPLTLLDMFDKHELIIFGQSPSRADPQLCSPTHSQFSPLLPPIMQALKMCPRFAWSRQQFTQPPEITLKHSTGPILCRYLPPLAAMPQLLIGQRCEFVVGGWFL